MNTSIRYAALTSVSFLMLALVLAGIRPLWLDEILQLIETREPSTAQMIANIPRNSGAAPLGYIVQHESLRVTGYSVRRARLPSAMFASAAVFGVGVLGTQIGLRHGWLAAIVFAAFPLTVRYATESRVYSQALFFSIAATILSVHLSRTRDWWAAAAYCGTLAAAAYTHPYAASVGLAHVTWTILSRDGRTALLGGVAVTCAIASFLPWYLYSKAGWSASVIPNALHFSASWKTPLMLFRELAGAGYWGSGLLLVLCMIAVANRLPSTRTVALLILCIAVPAISVFAADAVFDYFLAARQFLWVLPAVALLAVSALERLTRVRFAVVVLFGLVCLWQNIRYFSGPHEDWQAAAVAIDNHVRQGMCLTVAPAEHARFYEFFQPALERTGCNGSRMLLAVTPYATAVDRQAALTILQDAGYRRGRQEVIGRSEIIVFNRPD